MGGMATPEAWNTFPQQPEAPVMEMVKCLVV